MCFTFCVLHIAVSEMSNVNHPNVMNTVAAPAAAPVIPDNHKMLHCFTCWIFTCHVFHILFHISVGEISNVNHPNVINAAAAPAAAAPVAPAQSNVKMGEELPQCGVKDACGADSFPVHMYSGKGNSEGPKLCVSGK